MRSRKENEMKTGLVLKIAEIVAAQRGRMDRIEHMELASDFGDLVAARSEVSWDQFLEMVKIFYEEATGGQDIRPSFQDACLTYVHRFTMEHVPEWATRPRPSGGYYAPQYRSDREWYDRTIFPGESGHFTGPDACYSRDETWPLGRVLDQVCQP
jgi:hypothetical protein